MPTADFFRRFGFFVNQQFLDLDWCARIRAEVTAAAQRSAATIRRAGGEIVDTEFRKVEQSKVSKETRKHLECRLLVLKPALEEHFRMELKGVEDPVFLSYHNGDFYRPHRDGDDDPQAPEYFQRRRISVITFLNSETEQPHELSYCGGALMFYGIVDEPGWTKYGFSLTGTAGELVAFRSDVLHEVRPVTFGERFTIVSWYYS